MMPQIQEFFLWGYCCYHGSELLQAQNFCSFQKCHFWISNLLVNHYWHQTQHFLSIFRKFQKWHFWKLQKFCIFRCSQPKSVVTKSVLFYLVESCKYSYEGKSAFGNTNQWSIFGNNLHDNTMSAFVEPFDQPLKEIPIM